MADLAKVAREWLCSGGNGHEDGEDGIRAMRIGGESLIEFLAEFGEYLLLAERAPEPEGTRTDTGQLGEAMTEILLMLMEERLLAATSGQHELFERLGKMTWLAERAIGREDAGSPAERQEPSKLHNAGSSPASPSTFVGESPSSASEQERK